MDYQMTEQERVSFLKICRPIFRKMYAKDWRYSAITLLAEPLFRIR